MESYAFDDVSPTIHTSSTRLRRTEEAALLEQCWAHCDEGGSLRAFAEHHEMPPSTLSFMVRRAKQVEGSTLWQRLVETPFGVMLLHRVMLAALYVIVLRSGGGIRMVQEFLQLCGLRDVMATGYGSLQRSLRELEEEVCAFGRDETARLSELMTSKAITLAEDETFHGARPCLVAMDTASNFILVEEYAADRKRETWTERVQRAISSMPVCVVQCVTDGARALKSHVTYDLGAHASPDLFHVQHDVRKATSRTLDQRAKKAAAEAEQAREHLHAVEQEAERSLEAPRKPGRPRDWEKRIEDAHAACDAATTEARNAARDQTEALDAAASISAGYHLVDLDTGVPNEPEALRSLLDGAFATLHAVAGRADLRASGRRLLDKAHRVVESMVATLAFAWSMIRLDLDQLDVPQQLCEHIEKRLIPACYLEVAAPKAKDAATRKQLLARARALRADFEARAPNWRELDAEERSEVLDVAKRAAQCFQRSSSCVEGRNGVLALGRHNFRRLGDRRLAALTTIHNYGTRRYDGSTAAERFFENHHPDIFEHLCRAIPPPARPRKRHNARTPIRPT